MEKKTILLTFDYELFMGKRSGSVLNCLIKPTNLLLDILDEHKVTAVFFIDTTYINRLESLKESHQIINEDYQSIVKQLIDIVKRGHSIFHHLHPHWLDATYDCKTNEWNLTNINRFTFGSINENDRDSLFSYSYIFLSDIYKNAGVNKIPCGYRAGGLFIEPFSCFTPYFEKYGVRYEFSVVPGEKREGDMCYYDFTDCPKNRSYSFQENVSNESIGGAYIEYPITNIRIQHFTKLINGLYYRINKDKINHKSFGDGLSVGDEINKGTAKKKLNSYFIVDMPLSVELMNPVLLATYKKIIREYEFVHFLSHPKLLTPMSLQCLDRFLTYANNKFHIENMTFEK